MLYTDVQIQQTRQPILSKICFKNPLKKQHLHRLLQASPMGLEIKLDHQVQGNGKKVIQNASQFQNTAVKALIF